MKHLNSLPGLTTEELMDQGYINPYLHPQHEANIAMRMHEAEAEALSEQASEPTVAELAGGVALTQEILKEQPTTYVHGLGTVNADYWRTINADPTLR